MSNTPALMQADVGIAMGGGADIIVLGNRLGGRGLSLTSVKDTSGSVLPNVAVERQQPSLRNI
jgi:magnesium-transporting ATPase (P-type)